MNLAAATDLDKSTCLRIATALTEHGWLERSAEDRTYSAGPRSMYMAHNIRRQNGFYASVAHIVEDLRNLSEETVTLQRRHGLHRICVVGSESNHDIRRALPGPEPFVLHEGPSGKVILAFLDDDERGALDPRILEQKSLQDQLAHARVHGYLSTDGDRTPDVGALSVPVFDRAGVFGSLTIAGPSSRWTSHRRVEYLAVLLESAEHISANLLGAPASRFVDWRSRLARDGDEASTRHLAQDRISEEG
jgi:DNA-binding IclR family transcriptional regulator